MLNLRMRLRDNYFCCGVSVYAWLALLLIGLIIQPGCAVEVAPMDPLPVERSCTSFERDIRSHDSELEIQSLQPAPFGVRIIVDAAFDPYMGSSVTVPGGRMVWNVWVWHWLDGDHLGAIGRVPDGHVEGPVPFGGMCRWYDPL